MMGFYYPAIPSGQRPMPSPSKSVCHKCQKDLVGLKWKDPETRKLVCTSCRLDSVPQEQRRALIDEYRRVAAAQDEEWTITYCGRYRMGKPKLLAVVTNED